MAIPTVENNDTIDQFKTKVNDLLTNVGDIDLLPAPDSDIVSAILTLDAAVGSSTIGDDLDSNYNAFLDYVQSHDSDQGVIDSTQNDYIGAVATQAATNASVLAARDNAAYIEGLGVNHDNLTGFVANEHIDWTLDQGANVNINPGNYPSSTYTVSASSTPARHPTGGSGLAAQSGNKVVSSITVNSLGHTTGVATRSLTAANIGALATSGTATQATKVYVSDRSQYQGGAYSSSGNTVVSRDGSGYIQVHRVNLKSALALGSTLSHVCSMSATTGYIRTTTIANLRTGLYSQNIQMASGKKVLFANGHGWFEQDTVWMRCNTGKALYVGGQASDGVGIATTGDVAAAYSDMRLKEKVSGLDNALEKVCSLDGFLYKGNALAKKYDVHPEGVIKVGLSAQQVKEVLPEIIKSAPMNIEHGTDFMTVDYAKLVPLLVEAIKELKQHIDVLEAK